MPGNKLEQNAHSDEDQNQEQKPFPGMEIPGAKNAKGAKNRSSQEVADVRELNDEKNKGESSPH